MMENSVLHFNTSSERMDDGESALHSLHEKVEDGDYALHFLNMERTMEAERVLSQRWSGRWGLRTSLSQ